MHHRGFSLPWNGVLMRFYFHKTNSADFDRQVDRIWSQLPGRGPCVAEIDAHRRTMPDSIREYYFGYVLGPISKETGEDKDSLHEYFKAWFGIFYTDSDQTFIPNEFHVFGYASTLSPIKKEAFIGDVRSFTFHKLEIVTEPWKGLE